MKTYMRRTVSATLAVALLNAGVIAYSDTFNWTNTAADANWSATGSGTGWNGPGVGYPDATDDVANVTANITATRIITIDVGDAVVGSMTLADASNSWVIAGTNPLQFNVSSGSASLSTTSGAHTISAPVTLNDPLAVSVAGTSLTMSGIISGSGASLSKSGAGTLVLSGANTYNGGTTVNVGGLYLDFAAAAAPSADILANLSAITLTSSSTTATPALTVAGKTGVARTQTLGNLTLGGTAGRSNIVVSNPGTATDLAVGSTWTRSGTGATMNINLSTAGSTLTSSISDTVGATRSTTGLTNGILGYATVTDATATGFATVTGGNNVVRLTSLTPLAAGSNSATTNFSSDATIALTAATNPSFNSLTINKTSGTSMTINLGGNTVSLTSGGVLINSTVGNLATINNGQLGADNTEVLIHNYRAVSGTLQIDAKVGGGTGSLTIDGATTSQTTQIGSTLNNYTGNTVVNGGRVFIGGEVIPDASSLFIGPGALVHVQGSVTETVNGFSGSGELGNSSGTVGTLVVQGSGTFSGLISGGGSLTNYIAITKSIGGTLTLSNPVNTYRGTTTINGGILSVGRLANIDTTSSIGRGTAAGSAADLVFGGGTLQYIGAAATSTNRLFTIGNSNGLSGTLDASSTDPLHTLSFIGAGALGLGGTGNRTLNLTGTNTGNNTLASILGDGSDVTSLNKTGVGKWILSGANTYTGLTTVSGGTLVLLNAGTISSSLDLDSGTLDITSKTGDLSLASLVGVGTITAPGKTVTVTSAFGPGHSAGTINETGNFTLAGTATSTIEINLTSDTFDELNVTGLMTYGGILNVLFSGADPSGGTYDVFDFGTFGGSFSSITFSGLVGQTATFTDSTGVVSVSAVPEPSSLVMILFAAVTLWLVRRK